MPDKRAFRFLFTWKNPNDESEKFIDSICEQEGTIFSYVTYGRELAPTTGRPHLQGFVICKIRKTPLQVKAQFGGYKVHVKTARGSTDQCITYCHKDGDFVEYGDRSKGGRRAERSDRDELIEGIWV